MYVNWWVRLMGCAWFYVKESHVISSSVVEIWHKNEVSINHISNMLGVDAERRRYAVDGLYCQ
jgi:hypothetical protein